MQCLPKTFFSLKWQILPFIECKVATVVGVNRYSNRYSTFRCENGTVKISPGFFSQSLYVASKSKMAATFFQKNEERRFFKILTLNEFILEQFTT